MKHWTCEICCWYCGFPWRGFTQPNFIERDVNLWLTLISEPRLWMVVSSYTHIYVDMIAIRCNQHVMLHIHSYPYCWWKKSCTTWDVQNPVNNVLFTISTGAGFLPSTVCCIITISISVKNTFEMHNPSEMLHTLGSSPGENANQNQQGDPNIDWILRSLMSVRSTEFPNIFLLSLFLCLDKILFYLMSYNNSHNYNYPLILRILDILGFWTAPHLAI